MYIPSEMRHNRLEVTLRLVKETTAEPVQAAHINTEIMQKFRKAAESGEAMKHLKRKLAEGARFDFDIAKLHAKATVAHGDRPIMAESPRTAPRISARRFTSTNAQPPLCGS